MNEWELVTPYTTRLEVPDGWLYRYGEAMVFVPQPLLNDCPNCHSSHPIKVSDAGK